MYQYILFDLDGTVTNPKEGITKCVQYALNYFQIEEANLDNLICFIGPPLKESFMDYYGFDEIKANIAVQKYRERYENIGIFENGLYGGIEDMLKHLKEQNKAIALATSKPEIFAKRILEKYKILDYFDVVVGSELDGSRTNKAEVIEEVFKRLHITDNDKSKTVMVGDREYDIYGAKKCNIKVVGVEFGYAEENELQKAGADYIVETVKELEEFLIHN